MPAALTVLVPDAAPTPVPICSPVAATVLVPVALATAPVTDPPVALTVLVPAAAATDSTCPAPTATTVETPAAAATPLTTASIEPGVSRKACEIWICSVLAVNRKRRFDQSVILAASPDVSE
jgi:hypothetical protein